MQVINNFRAHVLHHSSAAEKLGKQDLASQIVSIKQEKNENKCSKLIGRIIAQHNQLQNLDTSTKKERIMSKIRYNEAKLTKLLNQQSKYQARVSKTTQSSDETNVSSAEAVSQLTAKLKESPELLQSEGVFRVPGPANGPSTEHILKNMDSLATLHREDPASLLASAIKNELDNALTDVDKVKINDIVKLANDNNDYIPPFNELPQPLIDVIGVCKKVVEYSTFNKMNSVNLSKVFSMRLAPTNDDLVPYEKFLKTCIEKAEYQV
jgi:hypothetical protein